MKKMGQDLTKLSVNIACTYYLALAISEAQTAWRVAVLPAVTIKD